MSYEDYFKVEEPKWHVFTDEEIALGELPSVEARSSDREAAKAARLAAR